MIYRILALLLVILFMVPSFFFAVNSDIWWKIELTISVSGTYECSKPGEQFSGHYDFKGVWLGAMERDNGDYILYQGSDRILSLKWVEEYKKDKFNLAATIKPKLKLNYVLRRGKKIHFDFETFFPPVPIKVGRGEYNLLLPRSAENDSIVGGTNYHKSVSNGSNQIELLENRIYRETSIKKSFNWIWRKEAGKFVSHHSVKVGLRIEKIGGKNP